MKSGLGDRNNSTLKHHRHETACTVSMKSGLGDRNNRADPIPHITLPPGLNEVRSWRPEQSTSGRRENLRRPSVSMKSGLGDRNNTSSHLAAASAISCLNEVRSWRPEQFRYSASEYNQVSRGLNEVRSWRPEQFAANIMADELATLVSMKSGLGDRNNLVARMGLLPRHGLLVSMKSGLGDRNNSSNTTIPLSGFPARLNEVRSWRPEQFALALAREAAEKPVSMKSGLGDRNNWLASEGGPDKELYQLLRALRPADPCNTTLLSCHGVKHLIKPLRALPRGNDTTTGLAAAHTTTGPSSGNVRGTPSIRMSASCGVPRSITTTES